MLKKIIATVFTKGFIALINLAILLVSSKQLGSNVCGQVILLILNIAIIQLINEVYTGYALVYFIPKFSLKKIYSFGVIWTHACTIICSLFFLLLDVCFDVGIHENWMNLLLLPFIIILHSFHMVILLAKENIRMYNFLNFLQPALLFVVLMLMIFGFQIKTPNAYIIALYCSFIIAIFFSSIAVFKIYNTTKNSNTLTLFEPMQIIKNGFYNQLANLSHMLSNRYNFYLLGNTILVGVYSRASSLIESVWIISGSVAPIVLTHIANSEISKNNARLTFLLSKICLLLSIGCVIIIYFLPRAFFVYLLGEDFIHVKTVMLYLSPGILLISFSTIISHYFAGLGKQKTIVIANGLGLLATVFSSYYFVPRYQLLGACYATIISYFVASLVLIIVFMKQNKFNFLALFQFKKDFDLLTKS